MFDTNSTRIRQEVRSIGHEHLSKLGSMTRHRRLLIASTVGPNISAAFAKYPQLELAGVCNPCPTYAEVHGDAIWPRCRKTGFLAPNVVRGFYMSLALVGHLGIPPKSRAAINLGFWGLQDSGLSCARHDWDCSSGPLGLHFLGCPGYGLSVSCSIQHSGCMPARRLGFVATHTLFWRRSNVGAT